MYTLFTHYAYTVHILRNIKNGFHDTIYIFKNYFATVFSVFNFQFSVFSNNKFNPNTPDNCFFEEFQTYSSETNHRGDLDQRVHFIVAVYSNHEAPVIIILLNLQTKFEKSRKSVRPI